MSKYNFEMPVFETSYIRHHFTNNIEQFDIQGKLIKLIVLVIKLKSGAIETIISTQDLNDKINDILKEYDEQFRLKSCKDTKIVDFIVYGE